MLRRRQQTVAVQEQPGLAAIPLADVDFLARHTVALAIPILQLDGAATLQVRVPTLGAYAVNKACTFGRRGSATDPDAPPKGAKDLLYLHDLMAAGSAVVAHIERDVDAIARSTRADAEHVHSATNHLHLALGGGEASPILRVAASMLAERGGGLSASAALGQLRGYLTDLLEILSEADSG